MSSFAWRESSRSNGMGANCVGVALDRDTVCVRDSKQTRDPEHPKLTVDPSSWRAVLDMFR